MSITPSLHVPQFFRAKSEAELIVKLLKIQAKEGGKVSIISIIRDEKRDELILFYYPCRSLGGGLM